MTSRPATKASSKPCASAAAPRSLLFFALLLAQFAFGQSEGSRQDPWSEKRYELGPDSFLRPDAPEGTLTEHSLTNSAIFPGTARYYSVYVPAQYNPAKPAALMVVQDGHIFLREDDD